MKTVKIVVLPPRTSQLVAQPGGDLVDPLHVRRVQVAVVLVMRVNVQPAHRRGVVARVEVKVGAELGVACAVARTGAGWGGRAVGERGCLLPGHPGGGAIGASG